MSAGRRGTGRALLAGLATLWLCSAASAADGRRAIQIDAGKSVGQIRSLRGIAGYPGPAPTPRTRDLPDFVGIWRKAGVDFVRTYDWRARLDTIDSPDSLFPRWAADPDDPASYNFAAADAWVKSVRAIGAELMFTFASEIPHSSRPPADLAKYARVVRRIVEHYVRGWGGGMQRAVRYWEFSDQPDFHKTHFDGTPQQFYAMYAAIAQAVKSVDPALLVGGPNLAFPLNEASPYREGFLDYVRDNEVPLDFVSWIWFTDTNRDPYDFVRVAKVVQQVLDAHGFGRTPQVLATFNMTGIPTAKLDPVDVAAYQLAALTYLQDAPVARVVLFRGDNGFDPNYQIYDPDHIFERDGQPDVRARAYVLHGQLRNSPVRLAASGGDDRGYAVLAGKSVDGKLVQILIANYAIPAEYLQPGKPTLEFTIPVGPDRAQRSLRLLDRRTDAAPGPNAGYELAVKNLPWGRRPFTITRYAVNGAQAGEVVGTTRGAGGIARLAVDAPAPSVELLVLRPVQ